MNPIARVSCFNPQRNTFRKWIHILLPSTFFFTAFCSASLKAYRPRLASPAQGNPLPCFASAYFKVILTQLFDFRQTCVGLFRALAYSGSRWRSSHQWKCPHDWKSIKVSVSPARWILDFPCVFLKWIRFELFNTSVPPSGNRLGHSSSYTKLAGLIFAVDLIAPFGNQDKNNFSGQNWYF